MTQVQTIEGNVVLAFRPPPPRPNTVTETPRDGTSHETGTVILFTGTRYERQPDAEPAAPDAPIPSQLDLAHS